jgi:hypothetical protein
VDYSMSFFGQEDGEKNLNLEGIEDSSEPE